MNQAILIVGPAGVGKTSATRAVEAASVNVSAVKLDEIAVDHWSKLGLIPRHDFQLLAGSLWPSLRLLGASLDALREYVPLNAEQTLLVELATIFQEIPSAVDLWRTFDVVAIVASPEVAYHRYVSHSDQRISFEEYLLRDFSPERRRVCDSAQHQVDTTRKSPDEAAEELAVIIRKIVQRNSDGPGLMGRARPWFADF